MTHGIIFTAFINPVMGLTWGMEPVYDGLKRGYGDQTEFGWALNLPTRRRR